MVKTLAVVTMVLVEQDWSTMEPPYNRKVKREEDLKNQIKEEKKGKSA